MSNVITFLFSFSLSTGRFLSPLGHEFSLTFSSSWCKEDPTTKNQAPSSSNWATRYLMRRMDKKGIRYITGAIVIQAAFVWVHTTLIVKPAHRTATRLATPTSLDLVGHSVRIESSNNTTQHTQLPQRQQCGVFLFYHIGKCGGTSVRQWQQELAKASEDELHFMDMMQRNLKRNRSPEWPRLVRDVESEIKTLSTRDKWLSIHQHHGTPGLRYMMTVYRQWKRAVESQGCRFILTTVLRDPLSRAKSLVSYNNIPRENFERFVMRTGSGQASYLLFGTCQPRTDTQAPIWCDGPGAMPNKTVSTNMMNELLGYLNEFDIVGKTEELDSFVSESERLTNWSRFTSSSSSSLHDEGTSKAPRANPSYAKYEFTSEMEDLMRKSFESDQILWNRMFQVDSS